MTQHGEPGGRARRPAGAARVESYLTSLVSASKTPGLQYLVVGSTGVVFEYAGGWVDIRRQAPVDADTTMMAYSMSKTMTAAAALRAVLHDHPRVAFEAGTRYAYSNIGYWLLGKVVERASGEPFPSYVDGHILRPLAIGPRELGYVVADPAHHATGYLEKYSWMNLAKGLLIERGLIGGYSGRWLEIRGQLAP